MKPVVYLCCVAMFQQLSAKSALKYFTDMKMVRSSTVFTFDESDGMNATWFEYRYVFSNKSPINVTGRLLKVGVFNNPDAPFDCEITQDDEGQVTVSGYSFELLKVIAEVLHLRLEFTHTTAEELQSSMRHLDLIVCHPFSNFNSNIVRLHSTLNSNYVIIYKPSKLHLGTDIFILTFVGTLWLCFLITFVVLALCLRISTRQYSNIDVNIETWNWVEITLWAIAAACQQGLSYTPNRFASRCIFFLGYLLAYLLYTGFAAAITSVLVRQERGHISKSQIRGVLYRHDGLNYFAGITIDYHVAQIQDLFLHLDEKNVVGIAPKLLLEQYIARKNASDYMFTFFKSPLRYSSGFIMFARSAWFQILNEQLAKMEETGVTGSLLSRRLNQRTTLITESSYSSASLEHVGSAIYLYVTGFVASVIFLLFECCLYKCKRYRLRRNLTKIAEVVK